MIADGERIFFQTPSGRRIEINPAAPVLFMLFATWAGLTPSELCRLMDEARS